jgi:hypothetical protein
MSADQFVTMVAEIEPGRRSEAQAAYTRRLLAL